MNEFTFRSSSSPSVTVRRMAEHRCSVLFIWGLVSPFVEGHGGVGPSHWHLMSQSSDPGLR